MSSASERDRSESGLDDTSSSVRDPGEPSHDPTDLEARHAHGAIAAKLFGTTPQPLRIGRYTVLERLGAGGMGVVYAAYDDQLDRRVALKVLRSDDDDDDQLEQRLIREAKAMARLAHPNVVAVYEVGRHEDRVCVAMEFVRGKTLRAWLDADEARPWPQVVAMFVQAGEGLAAAHAAGLVHRDFKPDNVLVGDDGRARVVDFGLARAHRPGEDEATSPDVGVHTVDGPGLDRTLTRTGACMGTPRYMAPEQHQGRPTDGRTDQFAFCVALWEALHREPPFSGHTLVELATNVATGRLRTPANPATLPGRVQRALTRGLAPDPDRRFRDMAGLLAELRDDTVRARRRWVPVAGVAIVGLSAVGVVRSLAHTQAEACSGGAPAIAEVWNDDARRGVARVFRDSGAAQAEATWTRTAVVLDDWAARWASMHRDACEANRRGDSSDERLDATMACLDQRRAGLRALVDALTTADAALVDRATTTTLELPPISPCQDALALSTWLRPPDDPDTRAAVDELRRRLAESDALEIVGRYDAALASAEAIAAEAGALDYRPLQAEALEHLGDLQDRTGATDASIETLRRALVAAHAGRHLDAIVDATLDLGFVLGYRKQQVDDALLLLDLGEGALEAMGGSDAKAAEFANQRGAILIAQGRYADAAEAFERSIELRTRAFGPEVGGQVATIGNLGTAYLYLGRVRQARDALEEALAKSESEHGPDHPEAASILVSLGNTAIREGALAQAQQYLERSIAIRRAKLAPDHPDLATALSQLGVVHAMQGRVEDGLGYMQQARALFERAYGKDHGDVAATIANISVALAELGRTDESIAHDLEALAIRERILDGDHPDLASSHSNVGALLDEVGRTEEAIPHFETALAIRARTVGAEHPDNVTTLVAHGIALSRLGRHDEAIAALEKAYAIAGDDRGADPEVLGRASFRLAKALVDARRDHDRALALAGEARQAYARSESHAGKAAEVDAWLAAHARSGGKPAAG